MKKILVLALTLATASVFAQNNRYQISTSVARTVDKISVTFWMQKTAGQDLNLGNSNFRIKVNGEVLPVELKRVSRKESNSLRFSGNQSYETAQLGVNTSRNLFIYNVYSNGTGEAKFVTEKPVEIGTVTLPVNDPQATIYLEWDIAEGDISDYNYNSIPGASLEYVKIAPVEPVDMSKNLGTISVSEIYPNPTLNTSNLILEAKEAATIQVTVMNLIGQKVSEKIIDVEAGFNEIAVKLADQKAGAYTIVLSSGTEVLTYKLVKQD